MEPSRCVTRIASKAGMSERSQRMALQILAAMKDSRETSGKDPMGRAASALNLADTMIEGEAHVTQEDIAEASGATEVTIRNRIKGMRTIMETLDRRGQVERARAYSRSRPS